MALTPSMSEVYAIFRKKYFFAFLSSLFKQFFSLFFRGLSYLGLAWFLILALSLRYFSTSYNAL